MRKLFENKPFRVYLHHFEYHVFRDFVVQDMDTNEIRHITQMAYLSWPDHGVPDSNEEFVDFVEKVRTCRQGYSLCPTVVHCSAGKLMRISILLYNL